jgi:hypothetical protein
LVIIGSLAAITGGAQLAVLGTDGRLASGPRLLSTPMLGPGTAHSQKARK